MRQKGGWDRWTEGWREGGGVRRRRQRGTVEQAYVVRTCSAFCHSRFRFFAQLLGCCISHLTWYDYRCWLLIPLHLSLMVMVKKKGNWQCVCVCVLVRVTDHLYISMWSRCTFLRVNSHFYTSQEVYQKLITCCSSSAEMLDWSHFSFKVILMLYWFNTGWC